MWLGSVGTLLFLMAAFLPSGAFAQSCNTADRPVLLILDSSGSMNAKLPNGETRIAVAKRAIKGVAGFIPAKAQLSLRMYGAQSPARQKNCEDTHVAVPFGPAESGNAAIAATADGVKAQGYTPIALSLQQAAGDFPADAKERVIVLVSDGKETCKGDPVLAAKALAGKVTVHTVGFVVDTAARGQLQNIARITGGSYFDAPVGPELPDTLKKAFEACKQRVVTIPPNPKPGKLRTTSAISVIKVFESESGKPMGQLDRATMQINLPAGTYEVRFGKASGWKGIEVRSNEATTIEPGELHTENRVGVIRVIDSETGEQHGQIDAANSRATLMPGLYDLRFGKAEWPFVKVDGGKTLTLKAAMVKLDRGIKWQKRARVVTKDGTEVFRFDAVLYQAALPPGEYVVEIDGNKIPFPATEGEVLEVKPQ